MWNIYPQHVDLLPQLCFLGATLLNTWTESGFWFWFWEQQPRR